MTDLTTITPLEPKELQISSDSLPEELERLLSAPGVDWTGMMLGKSLNYNKKVPVIKKESKEYYMLLIAIRQLELSLKPASPSQILNALARLRLHFTSSYMSAEEFGCVLSDYIKDLETYPKDILEQACIKFRKTADSQFFPKIGQLIKLLNELWYPRKAKLNKLRRLLAVSNTQSQE